MRKYYRKMLDQLYGSGEILQRSGSVNIEQPIRVQLYQKLGEKFRTCLFFRVVAFQKFLLWFSSRVTLYFSGLGENESDSTIVQNEETQEIEEKFDPT